MAPPYLSGGKAVLPRHRKARNRVNKQHKKSITKLDRQGGRGRPNEYSIGWIKKLLLLRLCGLTNHEVVQVLGAEGNAVNTANERTIQDYVKRLLGEPQARYGGPSKLAAQEQASVLRRLLKASDEEKARRSQVTKFNDIPAAHVPTPRAASLWTGEPLRVAAEDASTCDNEVSTQNQNRLSLACNRLSGSIRLSVSSSLLRAINRFSRSTGSTTSASWTLGLNSTEPQGTVPDLYSERLAFLKLAKEALDQICCGRYYPDVEEENANEPLCIHLKILLFMRTENEHAQLYWNNIMQNLHDQCLYIPPGVYGDSLLFFATRVGAPLRLLLSLIKKTERLDLVNAYGQTFLFFVNPHSFTDHVCTCMELSIRHHLNSLDCLFTWLERRGFDFERLDHQGRWFLPFLLAFENFDKTWLLSILQFRYRWRVRMARMAQLNDSTGHYLEAVGVSEDSPLPVEDIQYRFRRYADVMDGFGRTQLQQYIRTGFLHARQSNALRFESSHIALFINNYSLDGRTPMMEFVIEAIGCDMPSHVIREKLEVLIYYGANVNARSRGGHTVLHYVAGQARPSVVEFLLRTSIQKDHRDDAGRTAYDHAWHLFTRSRKRSVSPLQAARSFQSLVVFNRDRRTNDARESIHERSRQVCQMLEPQDAGQTRLSEPLLDSRFNV